MAVDAAAGGEGKLPLQHFGLLPAVWNETTFKPSLAFIESLQCELAESDFALLTLAPDDAVIARGRLSMAPRDNALCELGLLIGRLGRERTFLVYDKMQDAKVPTDPIKRLV